MTKSVARTKNRVDKKAIVKNFANVKENVWTLHLSYNESDEKFINGFFELNEGMGVRSSLGKHCKGESRFELLVIKKSDSEYKTKREWRKAVRANLNFAQAQFVA